MTKFELETLIFKYYKLVCDIDNAELEGSELLLMKLPKGDEIRAKLETLLEKQATGEKGVPGDERG